MKGEGQQKARGLGAFRGESRRRACYSSRIWGQFPSRLFFLEPLLLSLKRLPRCSTSPAVSRAPVIPPGRREDGVRPLTAERRCWLVCPHRRFIPFTLSSSICFSNAAGWRCVQASHELLSFLSSFSCPPLPLDNTDAGASATAFPELRLPRASRRVEGCGLPGTCVRPRSSPRVERLVLGKRAGKAREKGVFCGQCTAPSTCVLLSGDMSSFSFLRGNIKS